MFMWAVVFHPWMLTVSSLASCGLVVWLWGSWYVNFRLRLKIIYFFFSSVFKRCFIFMDGFIASGNKQQKYNLYEIMPAIYLFLWCHTISGLKTSASANPFSPLIDHLLMLWPLTCRFIPDRWHSPNCPQYHSRSSFWGFCLSTCRYCLL